MGTKLQIIAIGVGDFTVGEVIGVDGGNTVGRGGREGEVEEFGAFGFGAVFGEASCHTFFGMVFEICVGRCCDSDIGESLPRRRGSNSEEDAVGHAGDFGGWRIKIGAVFFHKSFRKPLWELKSHCSLLCEDLFDFVANAKDFLVGKAGTDDTGGRFESCSFEGTIEAFDALLQECINFANCSVGGFLFGLGSESGHDRERQSHEHRDDRDDDQEFDEGEAVSSGSGRHGRRSGREGGMRE